MPHITSIFNMNRVFACNKYLCIHESYQRNQWSLMQQRCSLTTQQKFHHGDDKHFSNRDLLFASRCFDDIATAERRLERNENNERMKKKERKKERKKARKKKVQRERNEKYLRRGVSKANRRKKARRGKQSGIKCIPARSTGRGGFPEG